MNPDPLEPRQWRRKYFWGVVGLVFAGQLGFIFWLGDNQPIRPRPAAPSPGLRLAGTAATELLALTDPTLFARPHREGFSGRAWLLAAAPEPRPFVWSEPPNGLILPADLLGAAFQRSVGSNAADARPTLAPPQPDLLLPVLAPTRVFPDHSSLEISGDLTGRDLVARPELPPWRATDLLSNSVVQVVVDADGRPVSVTLLWGSGLKDADDYALAQARRARFAPLGGSASLGATNPVAALRWGELIFAWHTLPTTATNRPAGRTP